MAKNRGTAVNSKEDELILVLDGIYSELERNIDEARASIVNELKYSAAQSQLSERNLYDKVSEQLLVTRNLSNEVKYTLQQNQAVHTDISETIKRELAEKLGAAAMDIAALEQLKNALKDLEAKLTEFNPDAVAEKVVSSLPAPDTNDVDYEKIGENTKSIVSEATNDQSAKVLEAIAAIPVAENVDYTRIVEEVGDRIAEIMQDQKSEEPVTPPAPIAANVEIDYDRIVYGAAEKVIESLPPVEKIDYEKLSDMVAAKITMPTIDYDLLADKVAEKLAAKETTSEVYIDEDGVQAIADTVANKVSDNLKVDTIDYDKVCQAAQAAQVMPEPIDYDRVCQAAQAAQVMPEPIDYDRIVDVLLDRLSMETFTFEEVVEETPAEETPAEEMPAEAVAEESPAEETFEEASTEEAYSEEALVEEMPAPQDEIAAAEAVAEEVPAAPVIGLIAADGDLVLRLKRSFVAKLKQSEDEIKSYYSVLKNALTEYKRINSNISWHGDRFNFGRDTVARMTIIGKTLGLYLALDPADPEFKQTVYRQKDVSKQKAYEGTPFMVKIKSDGGLKKALRLVVALADKLGTEKEEMFEVVDYVAMYPNATDEEMLAEGLIKTTKEKKVDLDF